jgi:hypothetical protein
LQVGVEVCDRALGWSRAYRADAVAAECIEDDLLRLGSSWPEPVDNHGGRTGNAGRSRGLRNRENGDANVYLNGGEVPNLAAYYLGSFCSGVASRRSASAFSIVSSSGFATFW